MSNQLVLTGGNCVSPRGYIRLRYRNILDPQQRWQCPGVHLAKAS
jgi:formylglycine-generating enzyme required for sulfatase activity